MRNKFQIIIKDLESGKVEVDNTTPAIVVAFATTIGTQTSCLTECNGAELLGIMRGLETQLNGLKMQHPYFAHLLQLIQGKEHEEGGADEL